MQTMLDTTKLLVFHEGRKRRIYVGELSYLEKKDRYQFIYDKKYTLSKNAIALGPNLDLFKEIIISPKGKLFATFFDRIPSKENPAYKDYCISQGISVDEKNLIVLLTTIGKRGPSSFVFWPKYISQFSASDIINFRKKLKITQYDFANAFDFNLLTIQRIESNKSIDHNTLKRIEIYLRYPQVALEQLKISGGAIHSDIFARLINYFSSYKFC